MNASENPAVLALYHHEQAPWAVMLLAKLHRIRIKPLAPEERKPYVALNDTLYIWWPDRARPLREIYSKELAACWQAYDRVPDAAAESLAAHRSLLTCAYLQLQVLDRFEKRSVSDRPALPNDLKMYGPRDFVDFVDASLKMLPKSNHDAVLRWIADAVAMPAERWTDAAAALDPLLATSDAETR